MTYAFVPHRKPPGGAARFDWPGVTREIDGTADQAAPPPTPAEVRVGRVSPRSVVAYLLGWTVVLLAVWVAVCAAAYAVLLRTGALQSVSSLMATVLESPVGPDGLLTVLTWPNALIAFGLSGAALAVGWFVMSLGVVLVHNALTAMTSGPRIRLKH